MSTEDDDRDVTWIEVTDEQVDMARIYVAACRSAGIEPDPLAVRMSQADELESDR